MPFPSNPIVQMGVQSIQSIYDVSTVQNHELGTRGVLNERVFYYAKHTLSTSLTKAMIYGNAAVVANDQNRTWAGTAGNFTITLTSGGTVAEGTYNEGWFLADSGGGAGQAYKIVKHGPDASNVVTITLADPLQTSASSTPTGSLQKNLFQDLVVFPGTGQAAVAVGVPNVTVPAGDTTAQYFWIQTQGPAPLICNQTPTIGQAIVPDTSSTTEAGRGKAAVETGTTADTVPLLGYVLIANGTDEHHCLVDLRIRA